MNARFSLPIGSVDPKPTVEPKIVQHDAGTTQIPAAHVPDLVSGTPSASGSPVLPSGTRGNRRPQSPSKPNETGKHSGTGRTSTPGSTSASSTGAGRSNLDTAVHYIPTGYEKNYAYPLIVWLAAPSSDLADETAPAAALRQRMVGVSDRNYLGLSVAVDEAELLCAEGVVTSPEFNPETVLGDDSTAAIELMDDVAERVRLAVTQLRSEYRVHGERIFIAGEGAAATLALLLQFQHPDWFAGVITVSGQRPGLPRSLSRFRELAGKRVFLAHSELEPLARQDEVRRLALLLNSSGLRVCARKYRTQSLVGRGLLRDVDRWIMSAVLQPGFTGTSR